MKVKLINPRILFAHKKSGTFAILHYKDNDVLTRFKYVPKKNLSQEKISIESKMHTEILDFSGIDISICNMDIESNCLNCDQILDSSSIMFQDLEGINSHVPTDLDNIFS